MTFWFSAEHYNLLYPGKTTFAGWGNYHDLLTHRALWVAMGNTLILVGLVLAITLIFGILFSLLLDGFSRPPGYAACWSSRPFS